MTGKLIYLWLKKTKKTRTLPHFITPPHTTIYSICCTCKCKDFNFQLFRFPRYTVWYREHLVFCVWVFRGLVPKACADMSIWRKINPLLFFDRLWCIILYKLILHSSTAIVPSDCFQCSQRNCVSSYHSVSKHWEMAWRCCCIMKDGGKENWLGPFSKTSHLIMSLLGSNSQINVLLIDSRMVYFTLPFFLMDLFVRSNTFLG